jgi:CheY-like chemotaxis protein
MEEEPKKTPAGDENAQSLSKATSELNNMLQIIAGTSSLIENIWEGTDGSEKYLAMLRTSIERAEKVTAELAQYAGGSNAKKLVHPELNGFVRSKSGPAAKQPRQTVLLVDDEEMGLTLVKRVLCEAGFHVITAQSGFECLDIFRRKPHSFDAVLLDLTMPFMDGEETFGRLREIRSDVPVVLFTGFIEQDRLDDMLRAGLSGFIRKPFAPNEIVNHVRTILEGIKFRDKGSSSEMPAAV